MPRFGLAVVITSCFFFLQCTLRHRDQSSLKDIKNHPVNGVMMQYFHWYLPTDGKLWHQVREEAKALGKAGFTALWLPPAYKSADGENGVGYGVYDIFDLGEFAQKGSIRTKYGTKDEYLAAIKSLQAHNVHAYADIVMNHMMGADETREVLVRKVNPSNRLQTISEPFSIKAWLGFTFPGRKGFYNSFEWKPYHFDGVDWADDLKEAEQVYLLVGENKKWDSEVSHEKGNYDYLMGADLDMEHPEVRDHLVDWGAWYAATTGFNGLRIDAVKHIDRGFLREWLKRVRARTKQPLFAVAEYWSYDLAELTPFLHALNQAQEDQLALFDAPLHNRFHQASKSSGSFDMKTIFHGSLVEKNPTLAVTLVENHDTQPLQALESPVEDWFKPLAYSLILLRKDGYPSVFYADYYGATYTDKGRDGKSYDIVIKSHRPILDKMLNARKRFAYGQQNDYFDHSDHIGWTRTGDSSHPGGLAVTLSDAGPGVKRMQIGESYAGDCFLDVTGNHGEQCVTIDAGGSGNFPVPAGNVSVWLNKAYQ